VYWPACKAHSKPAGKSYDDRKSLELQYINNIEERNYNP
jgi:hypothetical protein